MSKNEDKPPKFPFFLENIRMLNPLLTKPNLSNRDGEKQILKYKHNETTFTN